MAMSNRARPIDEVIRSERTPPRVRRLLSEIPAIKRFGEENGIRPTSNYIDYVKLDRDAASYVVSASEKLRFKSKEWKFPFVGAFPYLGWFDPEDARSHAEELRDEGWDVDLRGARAYSTLGWFRDAVLSTMIPEGPEALGELVNVVLHESVHATLYVGGQAYFNESVASFVADRLTPVYLERIRGRKSPELESYLNGEALGNGKRKRLHETYVQLEALYSGALPPEEKALEKERILSALQEELEFRRPINNATLIQYKTYNTGGAEFSGLLAACEGDWRRFFGVLGTLGDTSFKRTQQEDLASVLRPLEQDGCQTRQIRAKSR